MARRLLNAEQVGEMLQVDARTVRSWIREQGLPAMKVVGAGYRVDEKALNDWLDRQRVQMPAKV